MEYKIVVPPLGESVVEDNKVSPNLEKIGILIQDYSDGTKRSKIIDVTELIKKLPKNERVKKKENV